MKSNIILFDGDCFYCNKFILQILKNDKGTFKILDQNNQHFNNLKNKFLIKNNNETIYLIIDNNLIFDKSTAIIKILELCNLKYKIIAFIIKLIPKPIRDYLYIKFSKNRYYLSRNKTCPIPSKEIINRTFK